MIRTTSRKVVLAAPSAGTPSQGPATLLADYSGPVVPCEVSLFQQFSDAAVPRIPMPGWDICCGYDDGTTSQEPMDAGWFKLEYGQGSNLTTRYVDMVSRRYFLGACDTVRVSARRWRRTSPWPITSNFEAVVAASIGEATGGAYDEMPCTIEYFQASGAAVGVIINNAAGAYACDVGVETIAANNTPRNIWGGTQPPVWARGWGGDQLYFDWTNFVCVPQFRRMSERYYVWFDSNSVVTTDRMKLRVRWYLST